MAKVVKCVDCVYYRPATGASQGEIKMCHFSLDNGYIRGILPEDCYKEDGTGYISTKDSDKKNKMREMKKKGSIDMKAIDANIKKEALNAVNSGSMTIIDASEKYGVGKSTLNRWLKEEREAGFPIQTQIERECKQAKTPTVEVEEVLTSDQQTVVIDENCIKAAAYDVITSQMMMYPDSTTDSMMCFVQGVQALAQRLCAEVIENG